MKTQQRRAFIQKILKGGALMGAYPWWIDNSTLLLDLAEESNSKTYWKKVRRQYSVSKKYINLNNAGVNPQPKVVQESVSYYSELSNQMPSYYMWRVIDAEKDLVKDALATMLGCSKEDLALQRNTSEAMETIIFGMALKKGDEIVLSNQDYPHMKNAWNQRAQRDGVKLKWVELDLPNIGREEIINQYKSQISDQTKLVCITHITNWNGQVLPLKEIAKHAKSKGADVLVDAAHTLGQRPIDVSELEIDYLASSLHKWLGAPFGTGVLYVRKGKRKNIYPLLAGPNPKSKNIIKFEHLGTRSAAAERSILPAIVFCNSIGVERKMKRLQELKTYIVKGIQNIPGIKIQSPIDLENGSAILLFSLDNWISSELMVELMRKWNVHCTVSLNEGLEGIRISPNIYTQLSELDTFVEAIQTLSKK